MDSKNSLAVLNHNKLEQLQSNNQVDQALSVLDQNRQPSDFTSIIKAPEYEADSTIINTMQVGLEFPLYTWRKGGTKTDDPDDHLFLIIGTAYDVVDRDKNVLIEIDPETRELIFRGDPSFIDQLPGAIKPNTIGGESIKDNTITSDKLQPGIKIDGSVDKLTTVRLIDGLQFDGSKDITRFTVCDTLGNRQIKHVSVPDVSTVSNGTLLTILFTEDNTASNIKLQVNLLASSDIKYGTLPISKDLIKANQVYQMIYYNQAWHIIGSLVVDDQTKNKVLQIKSTTGKYNLLLTETDSANITDKINGYTKFASALSYDVNTGVINGVNSIVSELASGDPLQSIKNKSIINSNNYGLYTTFINYTSSNGNLLLSGVNDKLVATYVDRNVDDYDHIKTNTLIDEFGNAVFCNQVTANKFIGVATSSETSERAKRDINGRQIDLTYALKSDLSNYAPLLGNVTFKNFVNLPQIGNESDVRASTVGYVHDVVNDALSDLNQPTDQNYIRYDEKQSLTSADKTTALSNIGGYSVGGGDLYGGINIINTSANENQIPRETNLGITISTKQNNPISCIGHRINNDGSNTTYIESSQFKSTGSVLTAGLNQIAITVDRKGNVSTYAPTPDITDISDQIATTKYVDQKTKTMSIEVIDGGFILNRI